jgi:nucleotide-binding universal stress UspA family protein
MLRSILVPLDGSSFSERALPLANEIARASGASLHLAHVHLPHEPEHLLGNTSFQYEGVDLAEYDERRRRDEKDYLAGIVDRLGADGVAVDGAVLEGQRISDELVAYADEVRSDMILVPSHGYAGVRRVLRGSIADAVLHKTSVPILVIHPTREPAETETRSDLAHVLVPLDGSLLAERILGPACDLARATGARLTLTQVIVSPTVLGPRIMPVHTRGLEIDVDAVQGYLEDVAQDLRADGFDVSVHVAEGTSAAPAIAKAAKQLDADVIALATHGYGGLKRTLLGSTADRLVRNSRLPMLVMRPPFEA